MSMAGDARVSAAQVPQDLPPAGRVRAFDVNDRDAVRTLLAAVTPAAILPQIEREVFGEGRGDSIVGILFEDDRLARVTLALVLMCPNCLLVLADPAELERPGGVTVFRVAFEYACSFLPTDTTGMALVLPSGLRKFGDELRRTGILGGEDWSVQWCFRRAGIFSEKPN